MAKIIGVHAKVRDSGSHSFHVDGVEVFDGDDNGLPMLNDCIDGTYINLEIDIETGQIVNWKKPSKQDIIEMLEADDEEASEYLDEDDGKSIARSQALDKIIARRVELAKAGKLKRQKAEAARKAKDLADDEYYSTNKPDLKEKKEKKERENTEKIYQTVLKSMMANTKKKTEEQLKKEQEEVNEAYLRNIKGKK